MARFSSSGSMRGLAVDDLAAGSDHQRVGDRPGHSWSRASANVSRSFEFRNEVGRGDVVLLEDPQGVGLLRRRRPG